MKRFNLIKTALMLAVTAMIAVGCTKPDDPNNGGDNNGGNGGGSNNNFHNGHEFVDLGLPSGTLWATCNVGADQSYDHGYYFAWGETIPNKGVYTWANYKHAYYDGGFYDGYYHGNFCVIKYNYDPEHGNVDNLTVLEACDDAATTHWGGDWRMPTIEELRELEDKCYPKIWTTQNGVEGALYTGPNGNSIFLPATGYYNDNHDDNYNSPTGGFYWSSTLCTRESYFARAAYFYVFSKWWDETTADGEYYDNGSRFRGHCIRPVLKK